MKLKPNILALALLASFCTPSSAYLFEGVPQENIDSGLPQPDGGIRVIPRKEFGDKTQIKKDIKIYAEQAKNGFIESNSVRAKSLLEQKHLLPLQLAKTARVTNVQSTHLRPKLSNVKFGFRFSSDYN